MNRHIHILIPTLVGGFLLFGYGCASSSGNAGGKEFPSRLADHQAGRALLEAFLCNDAAAFVGCLPESLQEEFGEAEFYGARNNLAETLGEVTDYEYLTHLENPLLGVELWKVTFERSGSDSRRIRQQTLFRVFTGRLDNRPQVISFSFL